MGQVACHLYPTFCFWVASSDCSVHLHKFLFSRLVFSLSFLNKNKKKKMKKWKPLETLYLYTNCVQMMCNKHYIVIKKIKKKTNLLYTHTLCTRIITLLYIHINHYFQINTSYILLVKSRDMLCHISLIHRKMLFLEYQIREKNTK